MKTKNLIFIIPFLFIFIGVKSQTNSTWLPVLNSPDGTNSNVGVIATCMLSTCNAEDVVFLKLVNTNNHALKATWVSSIQTIDGKELYGKQTKITFNLLPNSENTGDCSGKTTELLIKLSDYGIKAKDFQYLSAANFALTQSN